MDKISGLSDELLIKILLFVPTKVAVSTSILSKRWEYLWMWLPKLEYGHRDYTRSQCKRLRSFLDRNLPLHRAPVIESFGLELRSTCCRHANINLWVAIAVSHCVRELTIDNDSLYGPANPNILPSNLYTCKSLVILKLKGEILLDVPRMVSLPSLKTLKLQSVRYFNDETLQRLLSNCPILEDLVVDLREEGITGKLTVVVPSLQSFSLSIPDDHDIDGIVIETPSLKYFKIEDHSRKSHYCLIENMPNLFEAYVNVELLDIKSLFGSISSVKRLAICSQAMCDKGLRAFYKINLENMRDEGFVFDQLERLELCICSQHSSVQLVRLLKASSNLQGLKLFYMDDQYACHQDIMGMIYWNQPSTVPECMLSSLQSLNWSGYQGDPVERDVAVYILKHAAQLKTATIKSCEDDVPKFEMIKELALSSRASATCQLMFD